MNLILRNTKLYLWGQTEVGGGFNSFLGIADVGVFNDFDYSNDLD